MKKNLLVTLADENYIEQAKQLFSSVYWNAGWKGHYMLLSHKIPEKELKWFRKKGILVKKCKPLSEITKEPKVLTTLSKFYLFTTEFKKWKNIVYLDGDMIVQASLDDLTKVSGFWAVQDLWPTIKDQCIEKSKDKLRYKKLKRNYNVREKAFNSGVMAFSTDMIEKDDFPKLKILTKKYLHISHPGEQVILNLFFYKKWSKLPEVYNFNPFLMAHPFLTKKNPKIEGIILHFPGSRKPWNSKYSFYYSVWKSNLGKSKLININKPKTPSKTYTKEEIKKYSRYIREKIFLYLPINFLDKIIGLMGIFLRNKWPKLYCILKGR